MWRLMLPLCTLYSHETEMAKMPTPKLDFAPSISIALVSWVVCVMPLYTLLDAKVATLEFTPYDAC